MQRLLYERYANEMKAVCLRYSKTSFEAEDIMHDGFVKVFKHIGSFKGDCPLGAWIRKIMVNTALTNHRRKLHKAEITEQDALETHAETETAADAFAAEELLELVRRLPDKYQIVFNLYAIEGYSHKEISDMLEVPEVTCRSQYLRARSMLKQMIEKNNKIYHEKVIG